MEVFACVPLWLIQPIGPLHYWGAGSLALWF